MASVQFCLFILSFFFLSQLSNDFHFGIIFVNNSSDFHLHDFRRKRNDRGICVYVHVFLPSIFGDIKQESESLELSQVQIQLQLNSVQLG